MKQVNYFKKPVALNPKKSTIDFILAFSKNLVMMTTKMGSIALTKS